MSSRRLALGLLPPCATTGIGSLPHSQLELGLQMALQQDIPYLPQLPRGRPGELMIGAALDGLPGLQLGDEGLVEIDLERWHTRREAFSLEIEEALASERLSGFEPSANACRALQPFLFEIEARRASFAKVQLAGPTTVRWATKTTDGRAVSEISELDQQIYRLVLARALALVRAVRRTQTTPIIFLDEPGLFALDPFDVRHLVALSELRMLVVALQREGALVGLHCCSNTAWPQVLDLGLDLVSIDARLSLDAVVEDQEAWGRFISSGATLSLGIVPTDLASDYELGELCESVEATLRATTPEGLPFEALLSRILLTPACGLGLRTVLDAERIVGEVREAQRRLRAVALAGEGGAAAG